MTRKTGEISEKLKPFFDPGTLGYLATKKGPVGKPNSPLKECFFKARARYSYHVRIEQTPDPSLSIDIFKRSQK